MEIARTNEEIILEWLKGSQRSVIDFREFRLAQRIDVDFGIETVDGRMVLAEIKSDRWVSTDFLHLLIRLRRDRFGSMPWIQPCSPY